MPAQADAIMKTTNKVLSKTIMQIYKRSKTVYLLLSRIKMQKIYCMCTYYLLEFDKTKRIILKFLLSVLVHHTPIIPLTKSSCLVYSVLLKFVKFIFSIFYASQWLIKYYCLVFFALIYHTISRYIQINIH